MSSIESTSPRPLPCPAWHIGVELGSEGAHDAELAQLPAKAAVFAFEDADGRAVLIGSSGNLRRLARSRLGPPDENSRTKTADLRPIVRQVRACRVGSAFEADWAYLQLARRFAPGSYQAMLDRWQAWFVHCDHASQFPQWVKTAHPGRPPLGNRGIFIGPLPDKHAAARYIKLLEDVFDLCRYHHILVQSPHGAACAYKEMGRCPAPCDGSVSMDHYREQIDESIRFAGTPRDQWRHELNQRMQALSSDRQYEAAQRLAMQLERAAAASKPAFGFVDHIERFRFVAVMPSGEPDRARLFAICGGWIQPWVDVTASAPLSDFESILDSIRSTIDSVEFQWSEPAMENMGMTCAHLFRARPRKGRQPGTLLRVDDRLSAAALRRAAAKATKGDVEDDDALADHELEPLGR